MSYEIKLSDRSFEAMLYAARSRLKPILSKEPDPPTTEYIAQYELIENRIDRAYPVVGVETIRFPHTHLNALLDVMILALHVMDKNVGDRYGFQRCGERRALDTQKRALVKHLAGDAITRLAGLTK